MQALGARGEKVNPFGEAYETIIMRKEGEDRSGILRRGGIKRVWSE